MLLCLYLGWYIYHPQGLAFCGSRFLCLNLIHRPKTSRYHPFQKDPVCNPNDNNDNNIGWDHLSSGDHCPGFFKRHELLPFQTVTSLVNDQANVIPKQLSLNFARECVLQCTGNFSSTNGRLLEGERNVVGKSAFHNAGAGQRSPLLKPQTRRYSSY